MIGIAIALSSHTFPGTIDPGCTPMKFATMETATRRMPSNEMAELSLLLPTWQIRELADAADARGMTVGQFLRGFIQQILNPFPKIADN